MSANPPGSAEDVLAEIRERLANIPPDQWFWDHFTAEDMWLVIELLDSVDTQGPLGFDGGRDA